MTLDPRLREPQVPCDGVDVEVEELRDLGLREPTEVVQLDDPGLALVHLGEHDQGSVECGELFWALAADQLLFAQAADVPASQRDALLAAAAVDDEVRAEVRSLLGASGGPRSLTSIVAAAFAQSAPASPARLADRFSVRGTLGVGGMGVVLEAFDDVRREVVALKTLERMDPQAIYDLKREFRTLADVVHPRLVRLHELFSDGDRWFFSMQRLDGVPFLEHVRRDAQIAAAPTQPATLGADRSPTWRSGSLDEPALRSAMRDLVDGVRAIHRAGKLHRDLKPSNVLVCSGRVAILDFGLARPLAPSARSTELHAAGTPAYMAPEQLDTAGASPSSDWYAVGAMLYEALTGRWPYAGSLRQILAAKIDGTPPTHPTAIDPTVPRDLAELAMQLLASDPAARPGEAAIVAAIGEPADTVASEAVVADQVFVGREHELGVLRDAYANRPALVRIAGASGIGKTALVDHFLAGLGAEPLVLRGRCYERESVPFKALDEVVDSLSRYLARIGTIAAAKLMPRHAAELCRVFPVLGRVPTFVDETVPRDFDPIELRRRAFEGLHEIITRIADRQPVVIAIDDVQWGDADSRDALAQLLDAPEAARALWIIGHRTGEEHSVFVRGLDELRPARVPVRAIEIAPLDAERTRQLVRARAAEVIDAAAIDAIARESAGSPFFIGELVRGGGLSTRDHGSLAELVRARVAAHSAEARRLVELVALAGRPVPLAAVLAAAGAASDSAVPELRAASLVRVLGGDGPALIDTYHDRIRESVAEALPSVERMRDHRALAKAFEAHRGSTISAELLALHYRGAGIADKAQTYTVEAARAASSAFAFDRAAELYRMAIELADDSTRQGLERAYGDALAGCGRGAEAADAYLRAAAGASDDDEVDLEAKAAYQLCSTGHLQRGHAIGRRVMARLGVRVPSSLFFTFVVAAFTWVWMFIGGFPAHAKRRGPDSALALRRFDLLFALFEGFVLSETTGALYYGVAAVKHARRLSDQARRAKALGLLAAMLPGFSGVDGRRSREWSRRGRALATEVGTAAALATSSMQAALKYYAIGDWESSRREAERAQELFKISGGTATSRMNTQSVQAATAFQLGRLEDYGALSMELVAGLRTNNRMMIPTHAAGACVHHLLADDVDAARRVLLDTESVIAGPSMQVHHHCLAQTLLGLYVDDARAARAYLAGRERDYRRASLFSLQLIHYEWLWFRTLLALSAGLRATSDREATALRREAMKLSRKLARSPIPSSKPIAMLARAAVAHQTGGDARRLLEEAIRGFDACSAHAFAAASRWQLGKLIGGDEGAALIEASEAYFRSQRAVRPAQVVQMFAPGFNR